MDFVHPFVLLLIPPLCWAIYLVGRQRLRRLPRLRALLTLLLRVLIAALLLLALADPRISRAAPGVHVVFVLDRSGSVGADGEREAMAFIQAAVRGLGHEDSASLVTFGAVPSWSGPLRGSTLPRLPDVAGKATDIAAALRLALGTVLPDRPSRLVLLSDGRQTQGDALAAAQQAAQAGVPISVVPLAVVAGNDVAVVSVDLPHYARSGDNITLRIGLQARQAVVAQVQVSADGVALGRQALALRAGLNTFFFPQTAGKPGAHVYRVEVQAPGDAVPQNDILEATTIIRPAPRVLVLAGDSSEAAPLVALLRGAGLAVTALPVSQAPANDATLSAYDAVVLADVPASALSGGTLAALRDGVYSHGLGLLISGGPHSFASGGYANSGLEALLPVTSLALAHAGRSDVALVLIIDKSGSMMDDVHGVSKISMAQQAAIEAIAHLQPTDEIGILTFDDTTHVVVPFGPVGHAAEVARARAAILNVQPFGDTVIYPALRQAARALFESHAAFKHVVLMTDGQGENAPFLSLIKLMRQHNITLSTIGIGSDAEVDELRTFAATGGGRFYFTADPHDIPRLVILETRISSGPSRVQGAIGVRQAASAPALRSLVGQVLPQLSAYNITAPRDGAQVLLQSPLGDPILAQWQYGLGRVMAWTGGTSADWARAWLKQQAFWGDAVRGLMPSPEPQGLRPDLSLSGGLLHVGADAFTPEGGFANLLPTRAVITGPDGHGQAVDLPEDAPGHYSATLPAGAPGAYRVDVAQYDGATVLQQATDAIVVPYPAEYLPGAPDTALLSAIAEAGQAISLHQPADAFNPDGLTARPQRGEAWPALALLALLLFPIDVALRALYTPPVPYDRRRDAPVGGVARSDQ